MANDVLQKPGLAINEMLVSSAGTPAPGRVFERIGTADPGA